MSIAILAACADEDGSSNTVNENSGENASVTDTETEDVPDVNYKEQYNPNFEPVDMGGYVFKFGTRDDDAPYHQYPVHTRDLYAEAETGDLINDAAYRRNLYLEEKYNIKFEMDAFLEASGEGQANQVVERSAAAGDKSYDLLMTHMMLGVDTAVRGVLHDIAQFPNIDLSKPYWNHGATNGASIGGRLFTGLSDLSFSTNENLYCVFFNKKLIQDYGIEDPYALVKANNWTFNKFEELIKQGYIDLNGDGVVDDQDQFGYVSSSAMNFLWSGGSHIMVKDAIDIPVLDFMTQRTLDIYEAAFRMTNNDHTWAVREWFHDPSIEIFQEGRGIFYSSQLCRVNDLRNTDFDFGIFPYPKWDSNQERYYSYVDGHASMMGIPINLPNPEWTGIIIEELSFLSYRDILPVYYDVVLNVKLVRDVESIEMLEILFDSKVFDPAYMMGEFWFMWVENIDNKSTDFVSMFERREAAAMRSVERKINALLAVE
jgi:hypothetical protein